METLQIDISPSWSYVNIKALDEKKRKELYLIHVFIEKNKSKYQSTCADFFFLLLCFVFQHTSFSLDVYIFGAITLLIFFKTACCLQFTYLSKVIFAFMALNESDNKYLKRH